MKKILLIVGMILCVAVIGSVFAAAVFNASESATVTADGYIYLGFNGTTSNDIVLTSGKYVPFAVTLTVDKNVANTGTLTITFASDVQGKSLQNVTYGIFSDVGCTTAYSAYTVTPNVTDGVGTITISGVAADTTLYIGAMLVDNADQATINACGGTMTLAFTVAA